MLVSEKEQLNIYKFKLKNLLGAEVLLDKFKGKVLLIVNTASECGYADQYKELEEIYREYKDRGFEVLAFPSNDFGFQEPLSGVNIENYCHAKYNTTFTIFNKIKVKGLGAHPLYQFLSEKRLNGTVNMYPKWNFHKYLVNKDGKVVDYYFTVTKPNSLKLKQAIEKLLG
jgi:glutathione peroxidase